MKTQRRECYKMSKKKVLIIDTHTGNLFSLQAAIQRLGYETILLTHPNNDHFDAIVIPGQGRFGTVMKTINQYRWNDYLKKSWKNNIPILGICVGMQVFFESSDEDPDISGMSWLKGKVEQLDFPKKTMVGWAVLSGKYWHNRIVYFVNSYAIKSSPYSISHTTYGESFCAAIQYGSLMGVQFHPEKSSLTGQKILQQVLEGIQLVNTYKQPTLIETTNDT